MNNPTQRITPLVSSLETTLEQCTNALKGGGDVAQVINCLTTVQQALAKLRPVIDSLVWLEDERHSAMCTIHSLAIELLVSLDETQPCYEPRSHAENVELIHEIFECLECTATQSPPDNVVNLPVKKEIPLAFSEAMHKHMALAEQYGEDSPQAKRSFMVAIQLAPDWFKDDMAKIGDDMGLLPQASGYLDNGEPVFSLADISAQYGISIEEATQSLAEMMAVREELGLSNEGKIVDPSIVHRKQ